MQVVDLEIKGGINKSTLSKVMKHREYPQAESTEKRFLMAFWMKILCPFMI